jgi:hypothetical protein
MHEPNATPAPADPNALPARTTPTWEMELLLAGATVFGLLQLPDKLDAFFIGWINASDPVLSSFVLPLGLYVQFAVFVLAITFVVHLCLRGYWVALVGLHSVFPGGVRADDTRYGPFLRAAQARSSRPTAEVIEAADNRATLVFAVGVGLAMAMVVPMLGALVACGVVALAGAIGIDVVAVRTVIITLVIAVLAPLMIATGIDRQNGARIDEDSLRGRVLRRMFDAYGRIGLLRGGSSLLNVFASQMGGRRGQLLVMGLILVAMSGVGARLIAGTAGYGTDAYLALPPNEPDSRDNLYARFYDSLRPSAPSMAPMPFINGPVVEGPYLRLFIPYRPRRHDAPLRAQCTHRRDAAALRCFAALVPVTLDGKPVAYAPVAASDPQDGQRGVLAMLRVDALAPGEHELTVQQVAREGETTPPLPYRIPFWR